MLVTHCHINIKALVWAFLSEISNQRPPAELRVSDQCLVKAKVSCYRKWNRRKKPVWKENRDLCPKKILSVRYIIH